MSQQPSTVAPGVLLVVADADHLSSIETSDLPEGTIAFVKEDAVQGQQNATPYFGLVRPSSVLVPSANTVPTKNSYNGLGVLVGTERWRRLNVAYVAP